ncbi:MAG: DUF7065 domain-containing protein [Acidimicrobiales bacterium]
MPFPAKADERRHPPADDAAWCESFSFEFFSGDGVGGYVTVTLFPNLGRSWYWAYLVGDGGDGPVAVIDDDVPVPRSPRSLELRTEGLWAEHTCETPLDHWTVGNEASAVRFDDPDEAYGRMRGDLIPLGFDLEWETDGPIQTPPDGLGYAVPCRVHGDVLVGAERLAIAGFGWRDHAWGGVDWASTGRVAGRLDDGPWILGDPGDVDIEPRRRAPVLVHPPGGDPIRLERSLGRVTAFGDDDATGWAWLTAPAAEVS